MPEVCYEGEKNSQNPKLTVKKAYNLLQGSLISERQIYFRS